MRMDGHEVLRGGGDGTSTGKEDGGEGAVAYAIDHFEFWLVILCISDKL